MKEFGGSLTVHLLVWNIICGVIGIIVFLIPDLYDILGLIIGISPYEYSILINILIGFLFGEILFFIAIKRYVISQYPYL